VNRHFEARKVGRGFVSPPGSGSPSFHVNAPEEGTDGETHQQVVGAPNNREVCHSSGPLIQPSSPSAWILSKALCSVMFPMAWW